MVSSDNTLLALLGSLRWDGFWKLAGFHWKWQTHSLWAQWTHKYCCWRLKPSVSKFFKSSTFWLNINEMGAHIEVNLHDQNPMHLEVVLDRPPTYWHHQN